VMIAGGVESMTRAPFVVAKSPEAWSRRLEIYDTTLGPRFTNPRLAEKWPGVAMALGETAEVVAERYGITREEQDRYALESQRRAARAIAEGRFREELVPVVIPGKGEPVVVEADEHPRPDVTLDRLAALRPAFRKDGTVTAGNSSGLNDGAAALLLMDSQTCAELHLRPLARIVSSAVAGVDPAVMGLGPVPATRKALARAGLQVEDIDLIELNEAFAAQVLACVRELGVPLERVNPNGGAIALGHPLGASGARILTTLVWELRRRQARYGLATMCIGVGQGIAMIVERIGI
jgi:acetyl-CoA acetyltransferase family protein